MTKQTIRELITTTNYNSYKIIGKKFIINITKPITEYENKQYNDILNIPVNFTREQENILIIELD